MPRLIGWKGSFCSLERSLLTLCLSVSLQFLSTLFAPLNFVMEKVESILPSSLWHQLTRIQESPPVLPLPSPSGLPPSLRANSSWTARKHDSEKGKPFRDFKLFMDRLFHIKSCFCCTKFIDVQFYYILPSEKKKKSKINFCVLQQPVCLLMSPNLKSVGVPNKSVGLHLIY